MKKTLILLLALSLPAFSQITKRDCFKIDTKLQQGVILHQFKQVFPTYGVINTRRWDGSPSLATVGGSSSKNQDMNKPIDKYGQKYFLINEGNITNCRVTYKFEAYYTITEQTVTYQGKVLPVVKMVRVGKFIPKK